MHSAKKATQDVRNYKQVKQLFIYVSLLINNKILSMLLK